MAITVIKMEDETWIMNNIEVPELQQLPTLIGCKMINDDVVAIVKIRTEGDKKGKKTVSKWKLIIVDLFQSKPPSSPDMLNDDSQSINDVDYPLPSTIIYDIFLIPRDCVK